VNKVVVVAVAVAVAVVCILPKEEFVACAIFIANLCPTKGQDAETKDSDSQVIKVIRLYPAIAIYPKFR
jgi:hypothetical protein